MTWKDTYTCELRTGYSGTESVGVFRTPHRAPASPHPVILLNGSAATAFDWNSGDDFSHFGRRMLASGLWCVSSDQGGSKYGAPAQVSAIDSLLTWLDANVPELDVSTVYLAGASMGGVTGLNWGRANPSKVGCLVAGIPLIGLRRAHEDLRFVFGPQIEDAYGVPALTLPGSGSSRAETPDNAALDLTGDMTIVADIAPADWTPATSQYICSKGGTTVGGYLLILLTTGQLFFQWHNGTSALNATSTANLSAQANGSALTVAVTFDADNGASGRSVRFWTSADHGGSWTQLGSTVTTANVTSIANSASALKVGADPFNGSLFNGAIRRLRVLSSIGGSGVPGTTGEVAHLDVGLMAAGATGQTDSAGRVWTITNGTVTNATLGNMAARDPLENPSEVAPFADKITFLNGELDPLCSYESAQEFAALHPTANMQTVVGGGHGLTTAQWNFLADEVINYAGV